MSKIEYIAILAKVDDGKIHPVALTEDEMGYVIALLNQLHDGKIKCLSQTIDNLELELLTKN